MRRLVLAFAFVLALVAASPASELVEPHLRIAPGGPGHPHVALTLDACMGGVDLRILDVLEAHAIPATVFVTRRWLLRNAQAAARLRAHPELFEVEDHGADHLPAVLGTERPYGLRPAGTPAAIAAEVAGGADAIAAAFGTRPRWYRDATALYSPAALELIAGLGYRVAGFSLNADLGATASRSAARRRLDAAVDGDIVLAHLNQPRRAAGAGIAEGILDLAARGFAFVRLADVAEQ